jgi:NitT/TauT family transport system substrate-binding protein
MERGNGFFKLLGSLLAVVVWLTISQFSANGAEKPKQLPQVHVSTAIQRANVACAPYVSIMKGLGWDAEEGIDAVLDYEPPQTGWSKVTQSDNPMALIAAAETVLFAEAKGERMPVKAGFAYYTTPWFWFGVMDDSPIKKISDLKGKVIGLSKAAPPDTVYLEQYLRTAGLALKDVETVSVGFGPASIAMLKKGEVHALHIVAGDFARYETMGVKFRYFPQPDAAKALFGPCAWVNEKTVSDPAKVDALAKYFKCLAKSVLFLQNSPEAVIRLHWKVFPEARPTKDEAQAMKDGAHILKVVGQYTGKKGNQWGTITLEDMKRYAEFGNIPASVDISHLVTDAFIKKANDFDEKKVIEFAKGYKAQ